jgi:hypothetical protein
LFSVGGASHPTEDGKICNTLELLQSDLGQRLAGRSDFVNFSFSGLHSRCRNGVGGPLAA